mgnify:CR=1 FL=1
MSQWDHTACIVKSTNNGRGEWAEAESEGGFRSGLGLVSSSVLASMLRMKPNSLILAFVFILMQSALLLLRSVVIRLGIGLHRQWRGDRMRGEYAEWSLVLGYDLHPWSYLVSAITSCVTSPKSHSGTNY